MPRSTETERSEVDHQSHAYLSTELAVVRTVGQWLSERGFVVADVSPNAYWRAGAANAAHGEPLRERA